MKEIYLYDTTYAARVHLLLDAELSDVLKRGKELAPEWEPDETDDNNFTGCTWFFDTAHGALPRTFLIAVKPLARTDPMFHATLTHELFHVVVKTLRDCDIPLSKNTEEAYAYLLDSLVFRAMAELQA